MADDMRESFPSLEGASGEGLVLRQVVIGDSVAGKNGQIAFGFRDSSLNATMPILTGDGRVPVSFDAAGSPLKNRGEVPAGSASGTFVTVAQVTLDNDGIYTKFSGTVSCRRAALFQLVHVDNGANNVLADYLVDSGLYTVNFKEPTMEVTGGSTGAQTIVLRAFNLDNQKSNLRGNVNCVGIVS